MILFYPKHAMALMPYSEFKRRFYPEAQAEEERLKRIAEQGGAGCVEDIFEEVDE